MSTERNNHQRMCTTPSHRFHKFKSAFNDMCNFYFKMNVKNIREYMSFFEQSKYDLFNLLSTAVAKGPIKYNIKFEATYIIPNTEVSVNRVFKTSSKPVFLVDDIIQFLESDFIKLLKEIVEILTKKSGFFLSHIDKLLLNINIYTPLGVLHTFCYKKILKNEMRWLMYKTMTKNVSNIIYCQNLLILSIILG